MFKVNNLSETYANYKYVVIRDCTETNEGYWYYGAYNDIVAAYQIACAIGNGLIVESQDVEQVPTKMDIISQEFARVQASKFSNNCISEELDKHICSTFKEVDRNDRVGRTWHKVYRRGNDSKYGSYMVSIETKEWRNTTMDEFYGDGIVD